MKNIFKKNKGLIHHSIKQQFSFIFIGLVAGTILICWFLNNTFLEKYYEQNKVRVLLEAYEKLDKAAQNGTFENGNEKFSIEIQKICGKYNIGMLVADADSEPISSFMNDPMLKKQLMDNIFSTEKRIDKFTLKKTNSYVMQKTMDPRMHAEFIEMWGFLSNGDMFIMRTAKEGIMESVAIANRFLAYVGIFSAIASGIIIWFVTRKVTEPILELAEISKRMTDLDFEAKYTGKSKNEFALLGGNINKMSERLELTISELKTANNELQTDIKKKEQIDEIRKEFLSNVSHELKTPIALIQGYAEGLKEAINDDEESRNFYCEVIMDEASKMNLMVQKLLTLNQLEFGNDIVAMERFDIVELIRSCIQSAAILLKQNEIQIQFDAPDALFVWADEFKTEEVFTNYLSNAINHCSKEKIIQVKVIQQDTNARIAVFNTGTPIPEESVMHLWEKFYKVDKARTREYGGSGIGLSIVKAIMNSMNQKFGVENYDNGVEFWFELETK